MPSLRILFTPLDWGLGHTTRCIPLMKYAMGNGHQVIFAGNHNAISIIKSEFPGIQTVSIRGYDVCYTSKPWLLPFALLCQIPKIFKRIKQENKWLNTFTDKEKIDLIISDNRYGMYHKKTKSIFITHQLTIQVPQSVFLQTLLNKINEYFIKHFHSCWIADYPINGLSGDLIKFQDLTNVQYLGNLSRFKKTVMDKTTWDILFLLSGPEPQRTILEKKILATDFENKKIILVRGLPASSEALTKENITVYQHLNSEQLSEVILQSRVIVCRSGYSTLMDLVKLQKHAVVIPTPGQTEQIYLAKYLHQKHMMLAINQQDFDAKNMEELFNTFNFDAFPNWDFTLFQQVMDKCFSTFEST
jgi:uncharacterized protein (TIGR00661 family)